MGSARTPVCLSSLLIALLAGCTVHPEGPPPPLSDLEADADTPLYATYCAPMERSEFVLDEGYQFRYYRQEAPVSFSSDEGGELGFAIAVPGAEKGEREVVLDAARMVEPPVVTTSYPDYVRARFQPTETLAAELEARIHSSRLAVFSLTLRNLSDAPAELVVAPWMQKPDGCYTVHETGAGEALFRHDAPPDGWTLRHDIPYVDPVYDHLVLLLEEGEAVQAQRWPRLRGEEPLRVPPEVEPTASPLLRIWGRMEDKGGYRLPLDHRRGRLVVVLNDDEDRILTQNSPVRGSSTPSLGGGAYYNVDLSGFGEREERARYNIVIQELSTGRTVSFEGRYPTPDSARTVRRDVVLTRFRMPAPPAGLEGRLGRDGTVELNWSGVEGSRYDIYRRSYSAGEGAYARVAEGLQDSTWTGAVGFSEDGSLPLVGYVVVRVDHRGERSVVSQEVLPTLPGEGESLLEALAGEATGQGEDTDTAADRLPARVVGFRQPVRIPAGAAATLRIARRVGESIEELNRAEGATRRSMNRSSRTALVGNELLYQSVPRIEFADPDMEMLYWSAWTMMRQVMLPPEGRCGYNYYVFSREPQWGWGHGGQVFHESLTMLAYAHMDPRSAMDSQRIYRERQHDSGYINYRTGPYLDEQIEVGGELTSSAPWYAWQNWEIYRITGDRRFLREMYSSSVAFYDYYTANRDRDGDGLAEWGAHAVLESVRDASVAVWDQVAWPTEFEGLDVNCMLVREAKALEAMARELGREEEAARWAEDHRERARKINELMWDDSTAFYYHVDRDDHDFSHEKPGDLLRREIIGFLPLWAGVATEERAAELVRAMTDTTAFWRPYGVPTLAADDPYYNPKGYWNGPVWVEWQYLLLRGLLEYGYLEEAEELTRRVATGMARELAGSHTLWEFYSPDQVWGGWHHTYIWAGLVNRMLLDVHEARAQQP